MYRYIHWFFAYTLPHPSSIHVFLLLGWWVFWSSSKCSRHSLGNFWCLSLPTTSPENRRGGHSESWILRVTVTPCKTKKIPLKRLEDDPFLLKWSLFWVTFVKFFGVGSISYSNTKFQFERRFSAMPDMLLPLALAKVSGPAVATAFAPKNVSHQRNGWVFFSPSDLVDFLELKKTIGGMGSPAWVGLRVYSFPEVQEVSSFITQKRFSTTRSWVEIYNRVNMKVGRQVTFETICVMHQVIQTIMKSVQRSQRIFGLRVDRVTQVSMGSGAFVFINWPIGYVVPVLTMAYWVSIAMRPAWKHWKEIRTQHTSLPKNAQGQLKQYVLPLHHWPSFVWMRRTGNLCQRVWMISCEVASSPFLIWMDACLLTRRRAGAFNYSKPQTFFQAFLLGAPWVKRSSSAKNLSKHRKSTKHRLSSMEKRFMLWRDI